MSGPHHGEITELLLQWQEPEARTRLFSIIYPELKRIAEFRMRRERPGQTLQPTALVHELFLHLVRTEHIAWRNRMHFLATASEAMRRILVDCARARGCKKRAGSAERSSYDPNEIGTSYSFEQVLEIDKLINRLATHDQRLAKVVELRYFGGLTFDEIAKILGVSERTAKRDWQIARAWLLDALTKGSADGSPPMAADQGSA